MKELWIDTETTGLNPSRNFLWQIAMLIVIDNEVVEQRDFKVRPPKGTMLNKTALEIGGITPIDLEGFPHHTNVYDEIIDIFGKYVDKFDKEDKFTMHGYNVHFDVGFMRAFFAANQDKYYGSWIWSNNVDVMTIASQYLKDERHKLKNFKLATVAEYLNAGIQGDIHDAMNDILITREIYKICTNGKLFN